MLEHVVVLPSGHAHVTLDRRGLDLGERGGFEARWAEHEGEGVTLEAYRDVVKVHLREVYRERTGSEPGGVTLNLASHQLIDDLVGWSRLNVREQG